MTGGTEGRTIRVGALLADPAAALTAHPGSMSLSGTGIADVAALEAGELSATERGLLALPAPSNAHDHGRGLKTIAFGAFDDTLEIWLAALGQEPASDPYLRAAVAFARLV